MGYLEELEMIFKSKDKMTEAITFRANIIILKMMYDELLVSIQKKYANRQTSDMGKECLYEALGTNRTDFSKMYNGHIFEARKKMLDAVKKNEYMTKAICGQKLMRVGNMVSVGKWMEVFSTDKVEKLDELNNSVKILIANYANGLNEEHFENQCCKWLTEQIKEWDDKRNNTIDRIVNEKVYEFKTLTFEELDECHPQTINNMYKDIQRVYGYIDSIYKYKCKNRNSPKLK